MSLSEILDDLNKDTANINTSLENITITEIKKNGNQISIQCFPKETIQKITNMFNLITLKKNIEELPRIDRNVALEVFAMLPNVDKAEQAKLTTVPSIINKEIIDSVFNTNIEYKISIDVVDKLHDLECLIKNHLPMIDVLVNYFKTFKSTVEGKVEVFKNTPPMVTEFKACALKDEDNGIRNIDLYTERFEIISRLDDTKLEYPKYAKRLNNMIADIYYNETLKILYECHIYVPPLVELSLAYMVQVGYSIIDTMNYYREDLNRYLSDLSVIRKQEVELNTETIKLINGYEPMVIKLETIGRLKNIIETKDNCFDKTAELVEFLD